MSVTQGMRHRRILLALWLATALLLVAYLFILFYNDWIGRDTLIDGMKSLNTIYSPYLAVILAYFLTASKKEARHGSSSLPDPKLAFWIAIIGTAAWNLVALACMAAPLFATDGGIEEAIRSVTDLAGVLSWLVAGSIGYYFGSSR